MKNNAPEEIANHLRAIHSSPERFENKSNLLRDGVIPLIIQLGYSSDQIYLEYTIPWLDKFYKVDAVVASSRHVSPWLMVEVISEKSTGDLRKRLDLAAGLAKACGARGVLVLTPHLISVARASKRYSESHHRLETISVSLAETLIEQIGHESLAALPDSGETPRFTLAVEDSSPYFHIDRMELERNLQSACEATEMSEKGEAFEALARYLFSGLSCVEIRRNNMLTSTGELDLVCRFKPDAKGDIFWTEIDPYFVVECKNWQTSVGSREIEILAGKIQKCRAKLGIMFSRSGITGKSGRDAVGNVDAIWRQHGIILLVITEETVRQIIQGHDFYTILESLYEYVRFSER